MYKPFIFFFLILITQDSFSQTYEVKGTVYDSTGTRPVPYVSVISTNGNGVITDLYGNYSIQLRGTDSIWFSYLNKPTHKYAYKGIKAPYSFNISIKMFIENLPK